MGTNLLGFAALGSQCRVGVGEFLAAPPVGTLWHRPAKGDAFTLCAELLLPILEIGDVVGLSKKGMMPLAPDGCDWIRIYDSEVTEANKDKAAILYKVVGPTAIGAYAHLPIPTISGAVAIDARVPPTCPPAGRRWMPFLVNGRNLREVFSVPVQTAVAA